MPVDSPDRERFSIAFILPDPGSNERYGGTPIMRRGWLTVSLSLAALLLVVLTGGAATAAAARPGDQLAAANQFVEHALRLARQGDLPGAKAAYEQFNQRWLEIEDGIKGQSQAAYRAIEEEMGNARFALVQTPPDAEKVVAALTALSAANERFTQGGYPAGSDGQGTVGSVADLLTLLDRARDRAQAGDTAGAAAALSEFRQSWLDVEGVVLTYSGKVYADAERDMVDAQALLTANPPDPAKALVVINRMQEYLSPVAGKTSYNMLDSASILLREGLEAFLVVGALLGFLKKAGHADKGRWIWGGVGAGLALSVVLAVLVKLLVGAGAFGNNNFLITGWTGIFAAVMLVYVSYWLHSKSSLAEWQRYIREKSTAALATGSLVSLATLSFLAVFREGTETVLFYVGMASSISMSDLLLGLGLAFAVLILLAIVVWKIGLRIPLRPFFLLSSVVVFYLAFKFTGTGIHALQLAGLLPAAHAAYLPSITFLAVYPNWQSTLPQVGLLILAAGAATWTRRRDLAIRQQAPISQGPL